MIAGVVSQAARLLRGEHLADPAPVQGDPIAGGSGVGKAVRFDLPDHPRALGGSQGQLALDQDERLAFDHQLGPLDGQHFAAADPALVHRLHRVLHLADAAVDIEHMEIMVRARPGGSLVQHQLAGAAFELFAEALGQRVVKLAHLDLFQQFVADPVGFDHAAIERVGDVVGAGDQPQVGQGTGEAAQQAG